MTSSQLEVLDKVETEVTLLLTLTRQKIETYFQTIGHKSRSRDCAGKMFMGFETRKSQFQIVTYLFQDIPL